MLNSKLALVVAAATSSLFFAHAQAATAEGKAKQIVTAALAIQNISDLDFGTAAAGDAAKTVNPDVVDNAENGSFGVTGQPGSAFTITLPDNITMTTGSGGANETIAVNTFTSFPAVGANGLLDSSGSQTLLVGASRDALAATQAPGTYTGTYTVTVVY